VCLPQSSFVSPPNEKQTRIYNLLQNVYFSTMVQNEEYNFLSTFILLSKEEKFYYHDCETYFVTCMLPYGETNLFFSSPRFCFLRNSIIELENEKYFTIFFFLNLVFLKPWNFLLGDMSHMHSHNPPWASSSLIFSIVGFLFCPFVCPIASLLLSTFCWNLFKACDIFMHLGKFYFIYILLIYL
jgi:hypothetical protein